MSVPKRPAEGVVTRAVIVSASRPWRAEARRTVKDYDEIYILGEGSDGAECMELCTEYMPDLILLDSRTLPELSFIRTIRAEFPSVLILAPESLSGFDLGQFGSLATGIAEDAIKMLRTKLFEAHIGPSH